MFRQSKWTFKTSAGASGGRSVGKKIIGPVKVGVGVEVNSFTLIDPQGVPAVFTYEAVTVGFGGSTKLSPSTGLSGSTEDMDSGGGIWMTDNFHGQELTRSDLEGICMFSEVLLGAGAAGSAIAMYLGCPWEKVATEYVNSPVGPGITGLLVPGLGWWGKGLDYILEKSNVLPASVFQQGAKALLVFGGQAAYGQIGASLSGGYGKVQFASNGEAPTKPQPDPVPGPRRYRENPRLTIPLPSDFLFAFDHADLNVDFRTGGALLKIADRIRQQAPTRLEIVGYTDSIGDAGYNMTLSKRRAETVGEVLVGFGLVQPKQVTITGYGSMFPVASNATDEGRARNRRVEIRVY